MRILKTLFLASSLILIACQSPESNPSGSNQEQANSMDSIAPPSPTVRSANSPTDSLDALIAQEPNNLEALTERGRLRLQRNNVNGALLDFQRVAENDSMYAPMLLHLGELRMLRNQSRAARNAWTNCAKADPEAIDCRINLAKLHASIQNYEPALKYLNELIEIDEFYAPAYLYKGIVIRDSKKDTTLAIQYFQKATELDQDYAEALDLMGVSLASMGDTLAQYYYKRLLELQPNNADVWYKLGIHYMNIDEINRAIEAYTKATTINPKHADAYYNLGYIFTVMVPDYREALTYYSKSLKAKPENNYKAHYGRGYAFEMLGDVINAEKEYRKTLALLPIHKPAKDGLDRINR